MSIFSGGAQFYAEFEQERILCLTGKLGTGKTLLAHALALPFLSRGYRFITNTSSVWAEDWRTLRPVNSSEGYKVYAVIDEGGLYVRSFKTVASISSFARKLNSFLVFSGKKMPHVDLQGLRLYLWFDFWKNFLIPVKVYRYDVSVDTTKNYHGYIWVSGQSAYYGLYSTLDPGDFPEELVQAFITWTKQHFDKYGRQYKVQDVVAGETSAVEMADIQNEMAQSARKASDAVSLLERKTKGR